MTFADAKRRLLALPAALAPLPLPANDVLEWPFLLVYLAGVAAFFHRARPKRPAPARWLSPLLMNLLGMAYLPFFVLDLMAHRGDLLAPVLHLGLFVVLVKLFAVARERDKWQAMIGIFFLFLASMATSTHPSMALFLLVFVGASLRVLVRFAHFHLEAGFGRRGAFEQVPLGSFLGVSVLLTAVVAVPLFAFLPRVRTPYIQPAGFSGRGGDVAVSGFSDFVTLDTIGRIRASRAVALRLRPEGDGPEPSLRLRGASFDRFVAGGWRRSAAVETLEIEPFARELALVERPAASRMTLWLEPLSSRSLVLPVETVRVDVPAARHLTRDAGGALSLVSPPRDVLEYRVALAAEPVSLAPAPELPPDVEEDAEGAGEKSAKESAREETGEGREGGHPATLSALVAATAEADADAGKDARRTPSSRHAEEPDGATGPVGAGGAASSARDRGAAEPAPAVSDRERQRRRAERRAAESAAALGLEGVTPRVAGLAADVMGAAGPTRLRAAALEEHLQEEYSYSLEVVQDGGSPIESFLFETGSGHCELFASSMVLMLRSQGVPARLVTGFLGGEYNPLEGYYIVRQSHAHAWVEAWLPEEGRWAIFDPTPPAGRPLVSELGLAGFLGQAWDFLEFRWDRYVLTYGFQDQIQVLTGIARLWRGLRERFSGDGEPAGDSGPATAGSVAGTAAAESDGVSAATLLLLLAGLAAAGTAALLHYRRRRPATATAAYRRLHRELARRGLELGPADPPLDVQRRAAERFPPAAGPAGRIFDLYLAESFGGRSLALPERRELARSLAAAKAALRAAARGRGGGTGAAERGEAGGDGRDAPGPAPSERPGTAPA